MIVGNPSIRSVGDLKPLGVEAGAEIVIFTIDSYLLVEPAEAEKKRAPDAEVRGWEASAPRRPLTMASGAIGQLKCIEGPQQVYGTTWWSGGDTAGHGPYGGVLKWGHEMQQPVPLGRAIGVRECNDLTGGLVNTGIPSYRSPAARFAEQEDPEP
jgi:hypothetical protein